MESRIIPINIEDELKTAYIDYSMSLIVSRALPDVPDGLNHYYELCSDAETGTDPNFKVFHWKSAEILPPDVIVAMKRAMSLKQYRQEFEASFETASGRIYEDYGKHKAGELLSDDERKSITLKEATERFDGPHPVEILVKLRPNNQWVKGFKVKDPGS